MEHYSEYKDNGVKLRFDSHKFQQAFLDRKGLKAYNIRGL